MEWGVKFRQMMSLASNYNNIERKKKEKKVL